MADYKIVTYRDGKVLDSWGCDTPFDLREDVNECLEEIIYKKIDRFEVRERKV